MPAGFVTKQCGRVAIDTLFVDFLLHQVQSTFTDTCKIL